MIITKFETWWVERGRCLFDEKRQGGAKMGWDVIAIKLTTDTGIEGVATCMAARSGAVSEAYLQESIGPVVLGRDPHDREAIFQELWTIDRHEAFFPVFLPGRLAVPVFHDEANYHFELGKGEQLTEGNDIAIIATGLMVNEARMAAEQLAAEGIHARVINIHTIKPLDEEIVIKAAKECGKVITAEEHNIIGGLGEAVCAVLSEKLPTPVRRVGVQDVFGCSGPAWDLLKKYGLDAATICKTAHEMLGK